ncbi:MAG TPA: hypothetical protein PLM60_01430 [Methanoregulaceae archaeon]|nr:hypothetical protein [Methanoregulaceae archaeon]HPS22052.1 hypothetical protein [Methanoregulaceae archaeon]
MSHSFFSGNSSYHCGTLRKGREYYQPENEACTDDILPANGVIFTFTEGLLDASTGMESTIALPLEPLLPGDAHIFENREKVIKICCGRYLCSIHRTS